MEQRIEQIMGIMDYMSPYFRFNIGPIPIESTIINQWLAMVVLFGLVFWITRGLKANPETKKQHIAELIIEFLYSLLDGSLGKKGRKYLPFVGTLFLFILTMNLLWFIPGVMPPTTDLSTTIGLALVTIIIVHSIGLINNGVRGYFGHFLQPFPVLLPLNLIKEVVKPVTLSLRLFGSMFGEKIAVTIFFILIPVLVPVPIMLLGALLGALQAFVFTLLTIIYLAYALEH